MIPTIIIFNDKSMNEIKKRKCWKDSRGPDLNGPWKFLRYWEVGKLCTKGRRLEMSFASATQERAWWVGRRKGLEPVSGTRRPYLPLLWWMSEIPDLISDGTERRKKPYPSLSLEAWSGTFRAKKIICSLWEKVARVTSLVDWSNHVGTTYSSD